MGKSTRLLADIVLKLEREDKTGKSFSSSFFLYFFCTQRKKRKISTISFALIPMEPSIFMTRLTK
ncbi:MAG: hypothetical protein NZ841_02975 [Dictyoglomus sp.]|nr:hypothetical protein [Dictyoglomus sp.]MDW8188241.1 hypothetical protein [Dictyoglomus sp.]